MSTSNKTKLTASDLLQNFRKSQVASTIQIYEPKIEMKDATDCLELTDHLIQKHGPRLAGTTACKHAAEDLTQILGEHCDSVKKEPFAFQRNAFLSFMKILAVTYVIGIAGFFIGGFAWYVSIIALLFGSIVAQREFVNYDEMIDRFFKTSIGYNVSGKIDPQNEIKQTIIISGHHDSANVFNFFKKHQKWYAPRIAIGLGVFHVALLSIVGITIFRDISGKVPSIAKILAFVFLGLSFLVLQFYFFRSNEVSPGAGDNLIASAMIVKLAQKFGKLKKEGHGLNHTRLIFLSNDAEESALRGSRAYVKEHKAELQSMPTYLINTDSIYKKAELSLMTSDINGKVTLSKELVDEIIQNGKDLDISMGKGPITWGGGACDSAPFARAGAHATTILGMENRFIRDGLFYHTMEDTVDKIEPDAVLAILKVISRTVCRKDF